MKILSLFDGMSCGYMAMLLAGIEVEAYDAYEIDQYAIKVSQHNFPRIVHHGNVFDGDFTKYEGYDFLIGGSPCTYWSLAQKAEVREKTAEGEGWSLFNQYIRALNEAKPKYFIFENNSSMDDEVRRGIDNAFGIEATELNSALVSAQNRQRLYWVGVRQEDGSYRKITVRTPDDQGILLRDILESGQGLSQTGKSFSLTSSYMFGIDLSSSMEKNKRTLVAEPVCINSKDENNKQPPVQDRVYDINGKATAILSSNFNNQILVPAEMESKEVELHEGKRKKKQVYHVENGQITIKGKPFPVKIEDGDYIIRKLTIRECMRLQTVPEWFDFSPISMTQAYKCLGNGWTIEIIRHLINCCLAGEVDGKQISIFDLMDVI